MVLLTLIRHIMFTPEQGSALTTLLAQQPVASLGTIHGDEPFVSMVPVVLLRQPMGFVVHVSRLATHTKDMLERPAVSLMLTAVQPPDGMVQALARATFQCRAEPVLPESLHGEAARNAYLRRFPQSEPMFGFADFSLFLLRPRVLRWVGGFGQATSVMADELARVLEAGMTA